MSLYETMTPKQKKEADRMTRQGGANEARGSEDAMKARNLRPMNKKSDKRGSNTRTER
jgi:hypothetical protein